MFHLKAIEIDFREAFADAVANTPEGRAGHGSWHSMSQVWDSPM